MLVPPGSVKCIDAPQRQELEPIDNSQNNFDHTI